MKLTTIAKQVLAQQNESVVTEAKNTIGLAFKDEDDYNGFVEFIEDEGGEIFKNIGWDSKTKSWEVIMDIKVLDSIYGEGTPANKESGWYGALPDDFESVIIESVVTEDSKDRMIKQIERALKDGTSIFKLPMATQKYYNKNKSDFESAVNEATINQVNLSSEEYQKMKKLKAFKQHEWKWNGDTQLWTKKQK
jgi:hypothetical protein